MAGPYIVLGNFRGKFRTEQNIALSASETYPEDQAHLLQLYSGSLKDASFEPEFRPDTMARHGSMMLRSVRNIEISPSGEGGFDEPRIYNFKQLLLVEPLVVRSHTIDGRTYGEIESRALGVTDSHPLIKPLDPDHPDFEPPPLVDETYVQEEGGARDNESVKDESGGNGSGNGGSGNGNSPWWHFGWGDGCFTAFWRILLALLLLYIIMALLIPIIQIGDEECRLKTRAQRELYQEQRALDSAQLDMERNLQNAIRGYGKIYFFRNSTRFHPNSMGDNSPIDRVYRLMDAYSHRSFLIEGFHCGTVLEPREDLDRLRAMHMLDTLAQMGIDPRRIQVKGRGATPLLNPSNRMSEHFVDSASTLEYNKNMRVEVKVMPKP